MGICGALNAPIGGGGPLDLHAAGWRAVRMQVACFPSGPAFPPRPAKSVLPYTNKYKEKRLPYYSVHSILAFPIKYH